MPIADNVSLAEDVRIAHSELVNLYGCTVGEGTQIGPFVEIQKNAFVGARCKISSHSFICEGVTIEDEVITTPHTWISTSWAISYVGAKPVFVDIDPMTYNIDPDRIERAITRRTKAILPVHLYGQACDMSALRAAALRHGLLLIEDAAQAHGAVCQGRRVGSFGKIGCFSFYPGKNLGAFGEAGAVVTDDEELAQRIRRLRDHAQAGRHCHVELGYNTRMEGIQGAVLEVKLRYLDSCNAARRRHAQRYCELLADVPGIRLPAAPRSEGHVWHLFVVLVDGDGDRIQKQLAERGVATAVHYPTPVPLQPAYADLGHRPGDFPVAEDVMRRCLSLPMFAEMTDEQIDYVAETLHGAVVANSLQTPAGSSGRGRRGLGLGRALAYKTSSPAGRAGRGRAGE